VEGYAGKQFVEMELHRRRSVIVRMTDSGAPVGDGADQTTMWSR
jgi:hypothetical protein